jgi:hypothetical protein|nr:MAG TPA: tail tube protein [Caudoviricetes sp.]
MASKLTPTEKKNAISGKNTLVGFAEMSTSTNAYGTYTTLPGVSSITAPQVQTEDIDQTCIAEDAKRTIAGAKEGQEVTITFHWYTSDKTQKKFIDLAHNTATVKICYQYQDVSTVEFECQLKSANFTDASLSETQKWEVVGKVQGVPLYTLS